MPHAAIPAMPTGAFETPVQPRRWYVLVSLADNVAMHADNDDSCQIAYLPLPRIRRMSHPGEPDHDDA